MTDTASPIRLKRVPVISPLAEFLAAETTGALFLLAATAAALIWANSAGAPSYHALWATDLGFRSGDRVVISLDLRHWVNEGLMALFFFVVGLEIKRQLVDGELADRRKAALPIVAAVGGMIVPALIYLGFNMGGPGHRGWGIPIATDIAFALGVLALVAPRAPAALRVFLLSVAIADDIGSIVVIAAFYAGELDPAAIAVALALLAGIVALWRVQAFWSDPPLVVLMVGVWAAVLASGIHPTVAGVVLGLITPAGPAPSTSPAERLEHSLHPWTSRVVIPLFALANAGIAVDASAVAAAAWSPVGLGIALGLVLGKLVGVSAGAYLAVRSGLGVLPNGMRWSHVLAVSALAGIGFTVSLFIASLSFSDPQTGEQAKLGILLGSVAASLVGAVLLRASLGSPARAADVPSNAAVEARSGRAMNG
jgi:NhaA family Na+:H+ antiporter